MQLNTFYLILSTAYNYGVPPLGSASESQLKHEIAPQHFDITFVPLKQKILPIKQLDCFRFDKRVRPNLLLMASAKHYFPFAL